MVLTCSATRSIDLLAPLLVPEHTDGKSQHGSVGKEDRTGGWKVSTLCTKVQTECSVGPCADGCDSNSPFEYIAHWEPSPLYVVYEQQSITPVMYIALTLMRRLPCMMAVDDPVNSIMMFSCSNLLS